MYKKKKKKKKKKKNDKKKITYKHGYIIFRILFLSFEPAHDKTYNKTCATSKDSDQGLLIECAFYCLRDIPITKTCLYNFDPHKPHFYIVKLGFTGVYIIFLISAQKHRLCVLVRTASPLCYSLEPPRRGGSNEYPQSMFSAEI